MRRGLWIGTGIAIGVGISFAVGLFALKAHARPQTEPQQADSNNGPMVMGTGGATANQNDICWVLFRDGKETGTVKTKNGDKALEADRYVLACYKVKGSEVSILELRNVTWDVKAGRLPMKGTAPEDMFRTYALDKIKQ